MRRGAETRTDHLVPETPDTLEISYTLTPSGERVPTKALVERMRRFRGRLTRALLCLEMGWDRTPANIKMISGICERWEVVTADYVNPGRPIETLNAERRRKLAARATEDAKRLLRQQILLAVSEQETAPLYKIGDLSW